MRKYEVMVVFDPQLEEEKRDEAIENIKTVISAGGTVGDLDTWGLRKLAYPIQKKNEGFYIVLQFEAEPDLPKELDRRLKISDAVMRHIIVSKEA